MKPGWEKVVDEISKRPPVLRDEPRGLMDAVAYAAELRARVAELENLLSHERPRRQAAESRVCELEAARCNCDEDGHHAPSCPVVLRETVSAMQARVRELEAFVRYVAENDHIMPINLSNRAHSLLKREVKP